MKSVAHILDSRLCVSLGELIAPTRCAGCERQGVLLCRECLALLSRDYVPQQACPKCAGPYGALTCTECWEVAYCFEATLALGILDGPLARAIVLFKDSNERRLADLLGSILAERVRSIWKAWADAICWIPATKEAIRRRGFDHGELLARSVADYLELPALPLLTRSYARDQRGLSRKQRLANTQCFMYAGQTPPIYNLSLLPQQPARPLRKVLLIDDVFTTGATVEAASQTLLDAGIQQVRIAVLGRAW
jgi:ComF family protein